MVTRRDFLKLSAAGTAALVGPLRSRFARPSLAQQLITQTLLPASSIPQFAQPLEMLNLVPGGSITTIVADATEITLRMAEFQADVLPPGTFQNGVQPKTWAWGYQQVIDGNPIVQKSYIGPVIVATRGTPTQIRFINDLGFTDAYGTGGTNVIAYAIGSDQTLHWADPLNYGENMLAHMATAPEFGSMGAMNYVGPIPAVPHLHGGEVPPVLDGGPLAWFTSDGSHHGGTYYTHPGVAAAANEVVYRYPNGQEASPIWFHDHTLGATRLNVFAGLAGGYLIIDPFHPPVDDLGDPTRIIPLILQDRSFDTNGQFFLPSDSNGGIQWSPNAEHPYWVPEFVGDVILINGKVWPYLEVQPAKHHFLFLNGSNARTYEMFLVEPKTKVMGPPMWVVGTDGGFLDTPVKIDPNGPKTGQQRLVMMPGERYEVVIDFADPTWRALNPKFSGKLVLKNVAKTPYPGGTAPQGTTVGQLMQFRVTQNAVAPTITFAPATGVELRSRPIERLVNPALGTVTVPVQKRRELTLNEVMGIPQTVTNPVTGVATAYPGGPLEILVNNTKWSGERRVGMSETMPGMYEMEPIPGYEPDGFGSYLSEIPNEGDTEVWEIVNTTADAHPIHLHLVQFQLINRQNYDVNKFMAAYGAAFPGGGWDPMAVPPGPYLAGVYIPSFGPPLPNDPASNPLSGGKWGGNPDVTPFLKGVSKPPLPSEAGWKDTVIMYPGQVTRIAVRWAPTDTTDGAKFAFDPHAEGRGYVWHCHIIDHEDNEMMRPDAVNPLPGVKRTYIQGVDY